MLLAKVFLGVWTYSDPPLRDGKWGVDEPASGVCADAGVSPVSSRIKVAQHLGGHAKLTLLKMHLTARPTSSCSVDLS